MNKIFAEGTILDELIGLGIIAGMLTENPKPETVTKFQKHLAVVAGMCECELGKFGKEVLRDEHIEAETARFATRELAKCCVKSALQRLSEEI